MKAKDKKGNKYEIAYSQKMQEKTVNVLMFIAFLLCIFVLLLLFAVYRLDQINAVTALLQANAA